MFGEEFKCIECGHTFHAGATKMMSTDRLPDATFYGTGDPKGLWVMKDGKSYCGPCSDKVFPQITEPGIQFKNEGAIFF